MEKLKIDRVVVVEGKYDKIKLDSILDAYIITTEGFGIFKNSEKAEMLRTLAREKGLIVATDSDGAGLVIRNYFNSIIPKDRLVHIYFPSIKGKEKRKGEASREGLLGVEGMSAELVRELFLPYSAKDGMTVRRIREITLTDLYDDGFRGKEDSERKRKELLRAAGLPENLSAKALLGAVNSLGGFEFYEKIKKKLSDNEEKR